MMIDAPAIPFLKMNGLGNEFVVIDARRRGLVVSEEAARLIADPKTGPGFDQLIVLERSSRADLFMRIINADGGEVDACGNATRCIGRLIAEETGQPTARIETNAGILGTALQPNGLVTVDMGVPRFKWDEIPLSEPFHDTRGIELQVGPIDKPLLHTPSVVNVGNPHVIFWVTDLEVVDLKRIGPILEHHPLFPERANVSLAHVTAPDALSLKVWERGVGLTRACGTAACAAAVAAHRKGFTGRDVTVTLPGGPLQLAWRAGDDHILMTGATELEYQGELPAALFKAPMA